MANNFFEKNKDIQFYVNQYIDWKPILDLREAFYQQKDNDAPASYEEALDSTKTVLNYIGHIASDTVYPNAKKVDAEGGAHYDKANKKVVMHPLILEGIQKLAEAGLLGMCFPRKYGGLNCGQTATTIATELLGGADSSLMVTATLQWGVGNVLLHFADDSIKDKYLPKLASGEYGAAMVLTEAEAGSDLGRLTTQATYNESTKQWLINGNKRFITNGQSQVHLVLARTEPDSAGDVRGISLFVVEGKDVTVSRIEEKLGLHGSSTCELVYENAPAVLIGKRRFGLIKYMFALMNEARLGVAAQGLGIAQTAYDEALKYSDEREQFGKKIRLFPPISKMLVDMKCEIEATRALIYKTSWLVDMYIGLEEHLEGLKEKQKAAPGPEKEKLKLEIDKMSSDQKNYRMYADVLTPLSKIKSGQIAISVTSQAVQVLGGSGYTKEFQVERYFRDGRIVDIYEGTSQLQAKAAISGVLNGHLNPLMDRILSEARQKFGNDADLKSACECLGQARAALDEALKFVAAYQGKDQYETYLHLFEGRLCTMLHDLFSAHLLMEQAAVSDHKKRVVSYYAPEVLTRVCMWRDQVLNGKLDPVTHFGAITEAEFD